MLELDERFEGRPIPHLRTIQGKLRERRPGAEPSSDRWSIRDADPEDAALILPALAMAQRHLGGGGGPARLAKGHAAWIARLRRAVPAMPVDAAYSLASAYWSADRSGWGTPGLDRFVAMGLWNESLDEQLHAFVAGWTDTVMTGPETSVIQEMRSRGISSRRTLRHLVKGRVDESKPRADPRITNRLDAWERLEGITPMPKEER